MASIILASLFAGIGTYVLRKGDLFNTFNSIINLSPTDNKIIFFTLIGIFLNLIAIAFWQYSSKSNIPFNIAFSTYLSLSLVIGSMVDFIFGEGKFDFNFFLGSALIISGIIVFTKSNYYS